MTGIKRKKRKREKKKDNKHTKNVQKSPCSALKQEYVKQNRYEKAETPFF